METAAKESVDCFLRNVCSLEIFCSVRILSICARDMADSQSRRRSPTNRQGNEEREVWLVMRVNEDPIPHTSAVRLSRAHFSPRI